jgi:hypothetical protein
VDNEWYFYDTGDNFWNDPQGGALDEPLSLLVMVDHPVSGNPEAVASGFNLWGGYLCYEPHLDNYSVSVALDLPLSSNAGVSADYVHTYNGLPPGNKTFFPVAFDCDGNGDASTVNSLDYFPASGNGFNFVKDGGLVFDDRDEENYKVTIYFGDDNFPTGPLNPLAPGGTDGLILQVTLSSEFGVIKPIEAVIPAVHTKSGTDLDLIATYGAGVVQVGGHDNPNPGSNPRIVDIEIKINDLKTIIEDDTYIDWNKVQIGKFPISEARKIYVNIKSGSLDDKSDEHLVQGGHVFPPLPFRAVVDKKVMCGDCAGALTGDTEDLYSLRESDLRFEVTIDVPVDYSAQLPNGTGYLDIREDCTYLVGGNPVDLPGSEWELCEITLNGDPNALACPDFNLQGNPARLKDKNTNADYLFEGGDQVVVVFAVYPNSTAGTKEYYKADPDIGNLVVIDAYDVDGNQEPSNPADAFVDLLKPELVAVKVVQFTDDNGVGYGPVSDLSKSWWDANVPPNYTPKFPVTVVWTLGSINNSPSPLALDAKKILDPTLENLQNVVWVPANMVPDPNPLTPGGGLGMVTATKIYTTYEDYVNDTNAMGGTEIHNTFTTDATVITQGGGIPDICYLKDNVEVPDYYQSANSSAKLYLRPEGVAINVEKTVSCFSNGPWEVEVNSFVGTWVYYRILIQNTSSVNADNVYVTDTLEKKDQAYTQVEWVSGPQFDLNQPMENIGPLAAGAEVEIIFRVLTNPNYLLKATSWDIQNTVLVEGDGPDGNPDPDPNPEATDDDGPIPIDILLGEIDIEKWAKVVDDNGVIYDYSKLISLPEDVAYPIDISWKVEVTNNSESPISPDVYVYDAFLEKFPLLVTAPTGDLPFPHTILNMPVGNTTTYVVNQTVLDYAEAQILDKEDVTGNLDDFITNTAFIGDDVGVPEILYTHPDICGTILFEGNDTAKIFIGTTPEEVPTLSEWGIILMAALLGGLILLRLRR